MARRVAMLIGILLVVVAAGAILLPKLIDINQYRGRIQSELQSKLGRQVQFGALSLKVFPLSVSVSDLVIQESPRFPSRSPFASAKQLDVKLGFFALLSGNVEVASLRIVSPSIELIRAANGEWNYQTLGSGSAQGQQGGLSLRNVVIEQGQVGITDNVARKPRAVYAPIDIDLREYTPGRHFDVDIAAQLPGQGSQGVKASLRGSGLADIEGKVQLDKATLSSLAQFAGSGVSSLDGTATGEVELRAQNGTVKATGKLALPDGKVKNQPLGYPIDLSFDASYQDASELLTIQSLTAKLGTLPLAAAGTVDLKSTPSRVNLNLRTSNASLTELARLAGVSGAEASGTLNANINAQGALPRPALNGTINTSALEVRGGQLKQPVKVSPLKLTLTPALIRSDPFTAQAGATTLNGAFTLANYSGAAPEIDLTLRAPNSQLPELLDIAKAFGAGADDVSGSGAVSLDIRAQGKLVKDAPLAVSGKAAIRNGTISLPSLAKPLGIKQADVQFRQAGERSEMRFNADLDELVLKEGGSPASTEGSGGAFNKLSGGGRLSIASATFAKIAVQQLTADCTFDAGVIRLSPVHAIAYKGRQSGSVTIDTRGAAPALDVKLQLDKADANQLLTATTSLKQTLEGLLNTNADLHITPKPGQEMAAGLSGTAAIKLVQGKLQGISLMNEAAGVAKILGFRKNNQVATNIVDLAGDFNITNGVAKTENLAMKLEDGSANVAGTINLVTQSIDLRLQLTLGKGLTQQYGGNTIGGLLSTAFGNDKGELIIPMMATGTMGNVRIAPDTERAASMKLKGLTGGQGTSPGETIDRVKGIFDAFRKKK